MRASLLCRLTPFLLLALPAVAAPKPTLSFSDTLTVPVVITPDPGGGASSSSPGQLSGELSVSLPPLLPAGKVLQLNLACDSPAPDHNWTWTLPAGGKTGAQLAYTYQLEWLGEGLISPASYPCSLTATLFGRTVNALTFQWSVQVAEVLDVPANTLVTPQSSESPQVIVAITEDTVAVQNGEEGEPSQASLTVVEAPTVPLGTVAPLLEGPVVELGPEGTTFLDAPLLLALPSEGIGGVPIFWRESDSRWVSCEEEGAGCEVVDCPAELGEGYACAETWHLSTWSVGGVWVSLDFDVSAMKPDNNDYSYQDFREQWRCEPGQVCPQTTFDSSGAISTPGLTGLMVNTVVAGISTTLTESTLLTTLAVNTCDSSGSNCDSSLTPTGLSPSVAPLPCRDWLEASCTGNPFVVGTAAASTAYWMVPLKEVNKPGWEVVSARLSYAEVYQKLFGKPPGASPTFRSSTCPGAPAVSGLQTCLVVGVTPTIDEAKVASGTLSVRAFDFNSGCTGKQPSTDNYCGTSGGSAPNPKLTWSSSGSCQSPGPASSTSACSGSLTVSSSGEASCDAKLPVKGLAQMGMDTPWGSVLGRCVSVSGSEDHDGDEYTLSEGDCNDDDSTVYPGAKESCDEEDQNCDGKVDEGVTTTFYWDYDNDGYGSDETVQWACSVPIGYVAQGGDCDEFHDKINPGATEVCNSVDDNCQGGVDEGLSHMVYPDLDGDGYGDASADGYERCSVGTGESAVCGDCDDTDSLVQDYRFFRDTDGDGYGIESDVKRSCEAPGGYAAARGDCNDADPTTHPFAAEASGSDGKDQDCGGADGSSPWVKDPSASIQAALDASMNGQTVWVGPGIYYEFDLDFKGKKVRLASVGMEERAVIDAQQQGRGFKFHTAETKDSVVDGWTIRNGHPRHDNSNECGGGMYLDSSNPTLTQVTLIGNSSEGGGGGICLYDSNPTLAQVSLIGNSAKWGGGGMYLDSSNPTLTQVTLADNSAEYDGGGMDLIESSPTLTQVTLSSNSAEDSGGGMRLYDSSPTLIQVTLLDNYAEDYGGGIVLHGANSRPQLRNSILAYNFPYNFYNDSNHPGAPTLSYCDFYAPPGQANHNLSSLDPTNLTVEPAFVFHSPNRNLFDDDLHLQPDSPLRDAGDPTSLDADGSRSDLGAYGGPGADFDFYADADQDGLYDGWEERHLGGMTQSGSDDADDDGLSSSGELNAGTLPTTADTDGDGWTDGAETGSGSNPLESSSQPGTSGTAVLQVPGEFESIQAAIDWCGYTCELEVGAGHYIEALQIQGKTLTLRGAGAAVTVLEAPDGGRGVTAVASHLNLEAITITGGEAEKGGGLYLSGVTGSLTDLVISGNFATDGGGMYLDSSSPTLTQVTFVGNSADSRGGGMELWYSSPTLTQVSLEDNSADWGGGGMHLFGSSPTLTQVSLTGNSASYGGGMHLQESSPTLTQVSLVGNAAYSGGGMYLHLSSLTLTQATLLGNSAKTYGGGMDMDSSSLTLTNATLVGNSAEYFGGGMYLYGSSPTLTHVTLIGNSAGYNGGGMYLLTSHESVASEPEVNHTILAYNSPYNLYNPTSNTGHARVSHCDLYAPPGQANHNLLSLDPTNLTVEPAFVFYSPNHDPFDDDLHLQPDSPLRDSGDPTLFDPDGSRSDLGAYGGAAASFNYYADADLDGLYDGWEERFLGGQTQTGSADPDGDGLSNSGELNAGTLPTTADTDGDDWSDGAESGSGSNPLESSSQPGTSGAVVLQVPEDFESIQAAIDWCWYTCELEVEAGHYEEALWVEGKTLTLRGAGASVTVLEAPDGERGVTAVGSLLNLEGLTITGGEAEAGGGLRLSGVTGSLTDLVISGNSAVDSGGGMALYSSSPTLTQVTLVGNSAGDAGGGMFLASSSPTLTQVLVEGNSASYGGGMELCVSSPTLNQVTLTGNSAEWGGGGIYLFDSNPTLAQVSLSDNSASYGGGMYLYGSNPTLTQVSLSDNSASYGGGMYLDVSNPTLTQVSLSDNSASYGGGMDLWGSSPTLNQVTLTGNSASYGGGMYLYGSSPTLTQVTLVGNSAEYYGGGMYLYGSTNKPALRNTILAYNLPDNLYNDPASPGDFSLTYCDLYAPPDQANHNLSSLPQTNLTVEPGFLRYTNGLPVDFHLAKTSPLINAGDPSLFDPDGSRSDIGIYGGAGADDWDRDGDGYPDYFWPGTIDQPPSGFSRSAYDVDDWDSEVH